MSLKSKGFLHFFFLSYGYIIINLALTPIRLRLLTMLLDKEDYGLLTLAIMTVSLLAMFFSCGSFEFLVRRLPGTSDAYRQGVYGMLIKVFGSLSMLFTVLAIPIYHSLQNLDIHLSWFDLLACGLALVLYLQLQFRTYYFLGCNDLLRFRVSQFLFLDGWFFVLLGVAVFVKPLTISTVLWTWTGWMFATLLITERWAPLKWASRKPVEGLALGGVLSFSLPLLPMIFGEWLFRAADRYFVEAWAGLERIADYSLCMNISLMVHLIGCNLIGIIFPEFNRIMNKLPEGNAPWEDDQLRRFFGIMIRYALALALPGCAALYLLNTDVLWILSDPKFHDAAPLIRWAVPASFFFLLHIVFSRVLMAMDKSLVVGKITFACALLNLLLNYLLISNHPGQAAEAAAVATWTSLAIMCCWTGWSVKAWRWIQLSELKLVRLTLATVILIAAYAFVKQQFDWNPLITVGVCGVISVVVLLGFGLFTKSEVMLLFAGESEENKASEA